MNTLPLQLKLKRVLLAGQGAMAKAKWRLLNEMGAEVIWWQQPQPEQLAQLSEEQQQPATRLSLVVIAGSEPWCNELADWAQQQRLLLNRVDNPQQSEVFIPAIVKYGKLRIGIGTGGINPVLARLIREQIEIALPQRLSALADIAARWHQRARTRLPDFRRRRFFWERVLSGACLQQLTQKPINTDAEDRLIESWMDQSIAADPPAGMVTLIGAGPGDSGLITLKGLRALKSADVVLHDALVAPEILHLARREAQIEAVGRRNNQQNMTFTELCQRMTELAKKGKLVCRLKGGDPSLFGRSGEEIAALEKAGVAWDLIPGVTSASAAAASLGLPLTHRQLAHSVRFITGHTLPATVDRKPGETLVVYMGYRRIVELAQALIRQDEPPWLPLVVIQNASMANEISCSGSLAEAKHLATSLDLQHGPVLAIIGETAALASVPASTQQPPPDGRSTTSAEHFSHNALPQTAAAPEQHTRTADAL